jgi:hypothetical protein
MYPILHSPVEAPVPSVWLARLQLALALDLVLVNRLDHPSLYLLLLLAQEQILAQRPAQEQILAPRLAQVPALQMVPLLVLPMATALTLETGALPDLRHALRDRLPQLRKVE